ncbi:MAG: hypothetical protein HN352_10770 [Bacteroidetes bacterium]|jgi:nitrate reductase molybdenum cofactor assembly chaperone|nr:hypothetical protein [Bacteroidota bacterium]MBT3747882.1 hypothetical protein [Bacteroidota bacterium]MBT4399174.1 hypothetical protein [Bacteroidota bacterium]MBT4411631.1 hypothetical protein [Bacteroidota bacterium]MBT5425273.1 hypothetical protein [Bacteroidota bacterium]
MIIFQKLSSLFDYPKADYFERMDEVEALISQFNAKHILAWNNYSQMIQPLTLGDLQEGFISSFDVQANTSLDVGHILFGEDKSRNKFLIHLKEEHAKVHHNCGREMPDYLPNLLGLLAISEDVDFVEELAISIILPALRLMKSGIGNSGNPYTSLFELLIEFIEEKFQGSTFKEYVPVAKTSCNFSKSHCHHG